MHLTDLKVNRRCKKSAVGLADDDNVVGAASQGFGL
jgi:hypothetical protein